MRRVVAVLVAASLALLPANIGAQGLPTFVGCHNEIRIDNADGKVQCVFDETKLYQRYSYYVRSYNSQFVCRIEVIELRHQSIADPAKNTGLKDPDSVKRFYRIEYGNKTSIKGPDGKQRDSFVQVMSGPEGLLVEVMTLIPIDAAPTLEDTRTPQEASF